MDMVRHISSSDKLLCLFCLGTVLMRRIRDQKASPEDTPIPSGWRNDRIEHITSSEISEVSRTTKGATGEEILRIKIEKNSTRSVHEGDTLTIYLNDCPVHTIVMIDRWSSNAILGYPKNN